MLFGETGNTGSCMGQGVKQEGEADRPTSPPKESKDKSKLVPIGSRYFSKDVSTTRFNFGVELGKSPSGFQLKSLKEIVSEKERKYSPVNKKLPAHPGSEELMRSETSEPYINEHNETTDEQGV